MAENLNVPPKLLFAGDTTLVTRTKFKVVNLYSSKMAVKMIASDPDHLSIKNPEFLIDPGDTTVVLAKGIFKAGVDQSKSYSIEVLFAVAPPGLSIEAALKSITEFMTIKVPCEIKSFEELSTTDK